MKALSIRQPWAWLIVNGHKDIENREWTTSYRGLVLIHAGNQVDSTFFANDGKTVYLPYAERVCSIPVAAIMPVKFTDYERGGIVGYAQLVDVVTSSTSPWFRGKYGFVLKKRQTLPFIPLRGQLGLFDVPSEIALQVEEEIERKAWEEDEKDMAQIAREWREYRTQGDEIPPWKQ